MSDETKALEIEIKTKADLSGAKAAEAQLERVATQAEALNAGGNGADTQLEIFGDFGGRKGAERSAAAVSDEEEQRLTQNPQRTADFAREENPDSSDSSAGPGKGRSRDTRDEAARPGIAAFDDRQSGLETRDADGGEVPDHPISQTGPVRDEGAPEPAANQSVPSPRERGVQAGREMDFEEPAIAAQLSLDRQAQAIAAVGGQLAAALELNTAEKVALFQRLIQVVGEGQSRLGALARRVEELEGRARGAMNR